MAGTKPSKNNPDKRDIKIKGKWVISTDCLKCTTKCKRGEAYLKRFAIKLEGKGVFCQK